MNKNEIYEMITNRVIESLKRGVIAWQKPWNTILPCNFTTKRPYNGINMWLCLFNEFKSPYYLTFKQVSDLGGLIKKGSKGSPIVFWEIKKFENKKADGTKEDKTVPILKYFTVFNAEQITGINFPTTENNIKDVEILDNIFANMPMPPKMINEKFLSDRACYMPTLDAINMPEKSDFKDTDGYYAVLSHEFIHSTGHNTRLKREGIVNGSHYGSAIYAFEELIAEMGSAFLCNIAGIETKMDNSASYIQSWIKALQNDHNLLFKASKEAEKAVKYMRGELKEEKAIIQETKLFA